MTKDTRKDSAWNYVLPLVALAIAIAFLFQVGNYAASQLKTPEVSR